MNFFAYLAELNWSSCALKFLLTLCFDNFRYKLVDMLSVCGDYEYQEAIMEIIFRMCSPQQIEKYTSALFPEDKQLQQTFLRITRNNFESDIRLFLNRINSKSLKIFTILSRAILFNDKKLPLLQVSCVFAKKHSKTLRETMKSTLDRQKNSVKVHFCHSKSDISFLAD